MKRLLPGAWLAASCGLMSIALLGCPGTLDQGVTGGGGGGGGLGGSGGGCEAAVFADTCASCHAPGGSAGLDLASANPASRLVGIASSSDPNNGSTCAGKTLLNPNTSPATGLFIDKITGAAGLCGSKMPIGPALTNDQLTCLTTWAASVTTTTQPFIEQEDPR